MKHFLLLSLLVLSSRAAETAAPIPVPDLTREILSSHPELKFYEAEVAAAKAGARGSAALNDPELSVDFGRKRVRDVDGSLVGEGTAWSVSVRQTFEWPGRLALRKAIANRQVQFAEFGLARFQQALAARAQSLAFSLFAADTKAAAVREVADRFAALRETFLAREPAGITPLLETRVIEAAELALQRRATQAELEVQSALIELNQLRGVPADTPLRVASTGIAFGEAPALGALLGEAREKNFEYRMRRLELEQQGYEVRLARNERFPGVTVGPFVSQEKAGDRETTVGVSLSLPLPATTRARSRVDVAEARQRQAEAAAFAALRELERDVVTAAQAFSTKAAETRRWAGNAVEKFREAAELADRHYRLGAVPIATYVELQNSYLEAVEAILETRKEAVEAGFRLQLLAGANLNLVQVTP